MKSVELNKIKSTEVILFDPSLSEHQSVADENFKFNIGLLSIASYLESKGIKTTVYYKTRDYENKLKKIINKDVKVVGISAMTAQFDYAVSLAKKIKKINPQIPIIVGGCHTRLFPEKVLSYPEFDVAVPGDGEYPMLKITNHIKEGKSLRSIKGIGYKDGNRQCWTGGQEPTDLIKLPQMNYATMHGFKLTTWYDGQKSMFVYSGTGCPYSCTFCINSVSSKGIRQRKIVDVVDEIEYLINKYKVTHLYPTDEFFCVNKTRLIEFLDLIEQRNLHFNWFIQNRVDTIGVGKLDVKLLRRMKLLGCNMMLLGAESGSNRMLKIMNKHLKINQIVKSVKYLKKAKIVPWLSFIIGMPDENVTDYLKTFKLIGIILKIYPQATISGPSLYRPIPGSLMYQRALSYYGENSLIQFDSKKDFVISDYPNSLQVKNCQYPWVMDRKTLQEILLCIERFYKGSGILASIKSSALLLIKLLYVVIVDRSWVSIKKVLILLKGNVQYLSDFIIYFFPKGREKILNQNIDPSIFSPNLWFMLRKYKNLIR